MKPEALIARLLVAIAFASAVLWSGSAAAQECGQESVQRDDFVAAEILTYKPTKTAAGNAFVPAETIKRSQLDATMTVMACGKYARVKLSDGRFVFVRRSSYKAVCTCVAGQKESGSSPGAGSIKMCEAKICKAS